MGSVKINTERAAVAAANIRSINESMQSSFWNVQTSVQSLGKNWSGSVAGNTIGKFNRYLPDYERQRHRILDDYNRFLVAITETEYNRTEDRVKALSAEFK